MSTGAGRPFFDQFIDDFFAECEEHVSSARTLLLQLEETEAFTKPREGVLDELLRNFHSIKGLSAMVGIEEITQLAHHIEDYLRELRVSLDEINPYGMSQVLAGITAIDEVLNARRKGEVLPDVSPLLQLLANVAVEARTKLRRRKGAFHPVEAVSPLTESERKWKFEFRPAAELAARGVTVSTVRDQLMSLGRITSASPRVLEDGGVAFDFVAVTSAPEAAFQFLLSQGVQYAPILEADSKEEAPAASPVPPSLMASSNVVRVEMSRLDDLMRIAGELVISRFHLDETLQTSQSLMTADRRALQDINNVMERQVRELRETVIRARMVPIGQIFERMRFVVRGLERETRKKIHVEIRGQDTELDKIIVERMMDPLLHLVRNSISHGIEEPDQRISAGKSPEGTIRLSASAMGDSVVVEVEDDGRGLDVEKISQRARSLGIHRGSGVLDSKKVLDIICAQGFTTRDTADLASGRGVGMSAVQSAVSELGGLMTLESTAGKGARFRIQLPLTLAIADSLLVVVDRQRFAIPQAGVREVFAVESSEVTVFENNEVVPYRGSVLPIVRLSGTFGLKSRPRKRIHILVIGAGAAAVGLAVDRITGQREIVVRAITDPILRQPGISGATELGDGRPVLILDVHALMQTQRVRAALENRS